ncbi:MAG TPA: PSD1 and planctomycete cytochrome C domain-containing protein, partial [Pirellulaceae bacterium]|nr:PSD1 and planctomycete cytochrome C domain-containing protein [Pirellulaceae bacterium]
MIPITHTTPFRPKGHRLLPALLCGLLLMAATRTAAAEGADGLRLFRERIEPVLKRHCYECHSAEAKQLQGGLRLDSRLGMLRGGDSGPAISPGKSRQSLLIQAIRHEGDYQMPPDKPKLPEAVIADFARWVDAGAADPRADEPQAAAADPRRHWAFQPVRKPALPAVNDVAASRWPMDTFVLAKLDERGWQLSPPAERTQLLRRAAFDLIGLPPTPDEIDAFGRDPAPDAYERAVDRLLASPHYGERQAQHWLDVVRFAETEGYEYDRHVPGAWRFRDYVIDAFNRDKPYDRFITEQIAGDEIAPQDHECLTASIFHRLGPVRRNAGNPEIALSRNEVLTERTDIVGTAFLGLSIGCARCHNHKLEPISQRDYYSLQAYLAATDEHNISLASAAEQAAWEAETATIQRQIDRLKQEMKGASLADKTRIAAEIEALDEKLPPPLPTIPATWNDHTKRTAIHVLRRGVWEDKGEAVGPRPPSVLIPEEEEALAADASNPRTRLAEWIASPEHPLTARVFVNRLWQQHFAAGLVATANDFGLRGERPSHPELLDWLAAEFVENGWQIKPLQRAMVLSATYRQGSSAEFGMRNAKWETASISATPHSALRTPHSSDPDNRLLWRFPRRRLSAEELRDAMLAVAGRLNLESGGPSIMPPVDPQLVDL